MQGRVIGIAIAGVLAATGVATGQEGLSVEVLEQRIAAQRETLGALSAELAAQISGDDERARNELLREQIRSILSEQEFRESLQQSTLLAGYDDGFFVRTADDDYRLNINMLMQYRWTFYNQQTNNRYLQPRFQRSDRTGFEFTRLRLVFSGHAHTPDLTYRLQLGSDQSRGLDTGLSRSWVQYRIDDALKFRLGKMRPAGTREKLLSNTALQFPSRSLMDAVFGLGEGYGVRAWGDVAEGRLRYMLDVYNGLRDAERTNSGRVITNDPSELDANPVIAARLIWTILGEMSDFKLQSDLALREDPVWQLAFHYAYNDDDGDLQTTRVPAPLRNPGLGVGGFGLVRINGLRFHQFGADTAFKWRGFSATAEYAGRVLDVANTQSLPLAPWYLVTGDDSTTMQHAGLLQVGYFLPIPGAEDKWEIVGRVAGVSALAEEREGVWQYAAGVNYYIRGNDVKLQADVSRVYESPISSDKHSLANVNDDALVFRVQLQVVF